MTTQFERYVQEVREVQGQLEADDNLPEAELRRMFVRLAFLREQIDLERKFAEQAELGAQREFNRIQEELDNERSP